MELEYCVTKKYENKILKDFLQTHFQISHRLLITLKKQNCIFVNDLVSYPNKKLNVGDIIKVSLNYEEDNSNIVPKNIPLSIIYEDECYLIVDKPTNLSIHPSILHFDDSLSNGIRYYFDEIGLKKKIRPITRLDKDTSGLVVFAKNEYIQECLIKQMKSKDFKKEYIAFAEGIFKEEKGIINLPIAREENSIIKRCINPNGKPSITNYEVLETYNIDSFKFSKIKCILETGRTHQIRVHLSDINHPLLGDDLYGGNTKFIKRQALHCSNISFIHPITRKKVFYTSPLPDDFNNLI